MWLARGHGPDDYDKLKPLGHEPLTVSQRNFEFHVPLLCESFVINVDPNTRQLPDNVRNSNSNYNIHAAGPRNSGATTGLAEANSRSLQSLGNGGSVRWRVNG